MAIVFLKFVYKKPYKCIAETQQFCLWLKVFQITLYINKILWTAIVAFKISVNLTAYSFYIYKCVENRNISTN